MIVRVRYAPSPTGLQHIGGIRTALFNYFFARSQGGTFILRIEDTDQERTSPEALQDLYATLEWLGIDWDEGPLKGGPCGPYIQSERVTLYREHAEQLIAAGRAYRCYCTPERLQQLRQEQERNRSSVVGYDRHCRNLNPEERKALDAAGTPSVIRLSVPMEGETSFTDHLMGTITRKNTDISPDPVLLKTDGFPTYHLANVIDDHLMGITHIMRAQEWIPSGPLHIQLYQAFGWEPPLYCHLPMVMGKDGQKLSKRHGSTAVRDFRRQGYLPEAILNYVSLLGWSYDDKTEFFTREQLEQIFTLEKINKAPGVFDYKKLEWFNGTYIRDKSADELGRLLVPYLIESGLVGDPPDDAEEETIRQAVPLVQERLKTLADISEMVRFLFVDIPVPPSNELIPKKADAALTVRLLEVAGTLLAEADRKDDAVLEEAFRAAAEELGVSLGSLLMPVRIAVTGSRVSPPLFGSIRLLGCEKALDRIARAAAALRLT